ncbi:MAG: ABC transporter permease [Armatimonadota bacterium]
MADLDTSTGERVGEGSGRGLLETSIQLAERGREWLSRQTFNPVFVRDARAMFRGRRIVGLQLLYVIALLAVMGIASWILYEERNVRMGGYAGLAEYGRWIFVGMFETQAVLLMLVVVAYSAGAISLEREKQTYEVLAITSLTSAEVVLGKIASVSSLCYLLMFTSAPLAAFSLFFGGVSPGEMAVCYGLLALKIPFWSALGILASIMVGRSLGAQVLTLMLVGAENAASVMLMDPFSGSVSPGLFSAFAAPVVSGLGVSFTLLSWPVPSWLLPIPYALLATALSVVGAAEMMPNYRPQRSPLLRTLLLANAFFIVFLIAAIVAGGPGTGGGLPLIGMMVLLWMWAVAFVPVFCSYPVEPGEQREGAGWAAVGPARWLEREARAGGGFCLLLWGVSLAAALLAAGLAFFSHGGRGGAVPWARVGTPELIMALAIFALSIIAYSSWGATLAMIHRARREVSLATLLIILVMNSVAVVYTMGYHLMKKVPSNPALVLASPAASASVLLSGGGMGSIWRRYTPEQALIFGLGYSIVLLCGAYLYYRAARRRQARAHGS